MTINQSHGPRLLDGAMGSECMKLGWRPGDGPLEKWAVENHDAVASLHRAYVTAGSDLINACTFGANRVRLGRFGCENEVAELNSKLVALARGCVPKRTLVAGNIGPTGKDSNFEDSAVFENARDVFAEQAKALVKSGVDCLTIETMTSLGEARAAVTAAVELRKVPTLVTMAFSPALTTRDGADPATVARELGAMGVTAVGCNCSPVEPDGMYRVIGRMRAVSPVPIIACPSAGLPEVNDGVATYPMTPADFAFLGVELIEAGATMIGGCCGTTPDHIKALTRALQPENPE